MIGDPVTVGLGWRNLASRSGWAVALALALAGCGEKALPVAAAADVADVAVVDAVAEVAGTVDADAGKQDAADTAADATGAVAPVFCTKPATVPKRSAACDKFDDGVYGKKTPWDGQVCAGKTYTCNSCRGGYPVDQGAWRAIDFKTEDPTTPLANGYKEVLTFDGNTWQMKMQDSVKGKTVDSLVEGWFWCSDTTELKSQSAVFVVTKTEPASASIWPQGSSFTGDLKHNGDDLLALGFYFGFQSGDHGEAIYCRIGSKVNGKACSDPFK